MVLFDRMLFGGNCYDEYSVTPEVGGAPGPNTSTAPGPAPAPPVNALWLVKKAEHCFERLQHSAEAYRLSRMAYGLDPFCEAGLLLYIAAMLDLGIKTELFYLGK